MKLVTSQRSPNFNDRPISVDFVVLHYTAGSLARTLELFMDPAREVSAHLVVDLDGTVHELVPCLEGRALRAWHAGVSRLEADGVLVEGFNDRAVGIEIVNLNGNIFPYTEQQYAALSAVMEKLKAHYPALGRPESVVGHEQVAGFRGKCDPGLCFDWARFFSMCYPGQPVPRRESIVTPEVVARLKSMLDTAGVKFDPRQGSVFLPEGVTDSFFNELSSLSEELLRKKG